MKKSRIQNIRNYLSVLLMVAMFTPCVLEAKKGKRADEQHVKELAADVEEQSVRQELTERLQQQFKRFKKAVKQFRDCLVDGTCTPKERIEVVDMANNLLRLSILAVGMGIVETGEHVTKKVE